EVGSVVGVSCGSCAGVGSAQQRVGPEAKRAIPRVRASAFGAVAFGVALSGAIAYSEHDGPWESDGEPWECAGGSRESDGEPREHDGGPWERAGRPRECDGGSWEHTGRPREYSGGSREHVGESWESVGK